MRSQQAAEVEEEIQEERIYVFIYGTIRVTSNIEETLQLQKPENIVRIMRPLNSIDDIRNRRFLRKDQICQISML